MAWTWLEQYQTSEWTLSEVFGPAETTTLLFAMTLNETSHATRKAKRIMFRPYLYISGSSLRLWLHRLHNNGGAFLRTRLGGILGIKGRRS